MPEVRYLQITAEWFKVTFKTFINYHYYFLGRKGAAGKIDCLIQNA